MDIANTSNMDKKADSNQNKLEISEKTKDTKNRDGRNKKTQPKNTYPSSLKAALQGNMENMVYDCLLFLLSYHNALLL